MKQIHHRDYILNLKLQNRIFWVLIIFFGAWAILQAFPVKIISPCPEEGCAVKVVYATDDKSELEQAISYVIRKFEPEGMTVVIQALDIMKCESHLNINAYNYNDNGSGDYGLFQINSIHVARYGDKFMHDWKANIDVAYDLYKHQSWNPWMCWKLL